jgi:hypothetical protein
MGARSALGRVIGGVLRRVLGRVLRKTCANCDVGKIVTELGND